MKLLHTKKAALIAALAFTAACGGKKAHETEITDSVSSVVATPNEEDSIKKLGAKNFALSLPDPMHIARMFKRAGLTYITDVTNPAANAGKYTTVNARALNLGVYSGDLAYATLNDQTQASLDYFKAIKTLSEGMNMSSIFESTALIKRVEKNLSNKDSLLSLVADLRMESDMMLKETDRYDVVYLSFAGAWVESVYIASQLGSKTHNGEITAKVVQQGEALKSVIKLLESYKNKEGFPELITDLEGISKEITALQLLNKPFTDKELEAQYNKVLLPKINELRKKIVSQS